MGGMAYKQYLAGNLDYNLDKVYINVGYCALFLSIAVYVLHLREHKS
ncbi:protein YpmT [Aeribacillus sp. SP014]